MQDLNKIVREAKKDFESDLLQEFKDSVEELDVEWLTKEFNDFLKSLKWDKEEKKECCGWKCDKQKEALEKEQDEFIEDFSKFLEEIQIKEETEEYTYENWTLTPIPEKEVPFYMVFVEWGYKPTKKHTSFKSAEEEASRLIKKEWREVTILKSVMGLEVWDIIEKHYK